MTRTFEGRVEGLSARGEGILKREGRVLVPDALPGERVRYRVARQRGDFEEGVLEEVLEPSPARRKSPCPHDHPGGCGGCPLLQADPAAVLCWKGEAFLSELAPWVRQEARVEAPRSLPDPVHYKIRARFFVLEDGRLAFMGRRNPEGGPRQAVALSACHILDPGLEHLRASLDGRLKGLQGVELRVGDGTRDVMAILDGTKLPPTLDPSSFEGSVVWRVGDGVLPLKGLPWTHTSLMGCRFQAGVEARLPASRGGAWLLASTLKQALEEFAGLELAVDLEAGEGWLACSTLAGIPEVLLVESRRPQLVDLRANMPEEGPFSLRQAPPEEVLLDQAAFGKRPDLVLCSGSPFGLGAALLRALLASKPRAIALFSRGFRPLGQDLEGLRASFRPLRIFPLELAPASAHLETLTLLAAR